jgi:hypothetical protein
MSFSSSWLPRIANDPLRERLERREELRDPAD